MENLRCCHCRILIDQKDELSEYSTPPSCINCKDKHHRKENIQLPKSDLSKSAPRKVEGKDSKKDYSNQSVQNPTQSIEESEQSTAVVDEYDVRKSTQTDLLQDALKDTCALETLSIADAISEAMEEASISKDFGKYSLEKQKQSEPESKTYESTGKGEKLLDITSALTSENASPLTNDPSKAGLNKEVRDWEMYSNVSTEDLLKEVTKEMDEYSDSPVNENSSKVHTHVNPVYSPNKTSPNYSKRVAVVSPTNTRQLRVRHPSSLCTLTDFKSLSLGKALDSLVETALPSCPNIYNIDYSSPSKNIKTSSFASLEDTDIPVESKLNPAEGLDALYLLPKSLLVKPYGAQPIEKDSKKKTEENVSVQYLDSLPSRKPSEECKNILKTVEAACKDSSAFVSEESSEGSSYKDKCNVVQSPKKALLVKGKTSDSPNKLVVLKELDVLKERLNSGKDELERRSQEIELGKSNIEYYIDKITFLKNQNVEKIKCEVTQLSDTIGEIETKYELNRILNVSLNLLNFKNRGTFLNEIRRRLQCGKLVSVIHDFEGKQLTGKVTLRKKTLFVHSMSTRTISGNDCTVRFRDMKKCFRHDEDKVFLVYFSPRDQYKLALITLTNNPVNHQFIKLCTGEFGATYKGAHFTQDIPSLSELCGTIVDVSEYMIDQRACSGPIDYVTGSTWTTCLPRERIVTGSNDGSFKIEKFPASIVTEIRSVIGKVLETTNALEEDDFIYILDNEEKERKSTIEDSGLALKF